MSIESGEVLILGIGNLLMGDEGVGVHVVQQLQQRSLPEGVQCMDGGTGGFHLLGPLQSARKIVLVDAAADGAAAGTVRRLRPRFSKEYPRTLTAHDIGLKDLLDVFYLLGGSREVTLFAVSIDPLNEVGTALSPRITALVPELAETVLQEAITCLASIESG